MPDANLINAEGNKNRAVLVALVAAVSTMQILMNHRKNAIVNFSDDVIFQKSIFGRI